MRRPLPVCDCSAAVLCSDARRRGIWHCVVMRGLSVCSVQPCAAKASLHLHVERGILETVDFTRIVRSHANQSADIADPVEQFNGAGDGRWEQGVGGMGGGSR